MRRQSPLGCPGYRFVNGQCSSGGYALIFQGSSGRFGGSPLRECSRLQLGQMHRFGLGPPSLLVQFGLMAGFDGAFLFQ